MGKTYMMILLMLFVVSFVSGEDQVFLIPASGDITVDTTAVKNAIVGVGIDYESIHRSDVDNIAIHVFGTLLDISDDGNGKITFTPTIPEGPGCHSGSGYLSALPSFLIGILMIMICSGRFNTMLLIMFVLLVFGSVSTVSSVATVRIIIFLPDDLANSKLDTLTVNAYVIPIVSPEVDADPKLTVNCQVKGTAVACGSQITNYTLGGTNPGLIDNAEYVGVLLPLTGPNAILGPVIYSAIENYVNLDGFSLPYLQYVFCDTQANKDTALKFVDELFAKHNTTIYIGPLTSDESIGIMDKYDNKVVVISPAATSRSLQNPNTFISLSMGNEEYVLALNMIIENDFSNTLENIIVIYRNDSYGQDLIDIIPYYFEVFNLLTFAYLPDNSNIPDVVAEAAKEPHYNNTAVIVISYGEIGSILKAADTTNLVNYPWYSIGLSFNPALTDSAVIDISKKVGFKALEYRGSNIEAHTADRTAFYEKFCKQFDRPLPSSPALGYDAALLIANTPLIFETTPYQAYFLLVEQGDVTFGLSGWLSLANTGYRASGDFISELVVYTNENPLQDNWLELGYVELDRHKIDKQDYFEITFRVVSNYVVPGNWSTERNCAGTADLQFFARNIRREYQIFDLPVSDQDQSIPLYDTFLIQYNCGASVMTQLCPSALYGSDTQCQIEYDAIGKKRDASSNQAPAPTQRQVCNNAASNKGCVNGGAVGACEKSNSTCAAAAFKDGCTKSPPFCKK
jgi:ABC-type branched-subunit amino acid transport system substrate-binding protein